MHWKYMYKTSMSITVQHNNHEIAFNQLLRCCGWNISWDQARVNFMAADALAPCFARSSAAIILKLHDRNYIKSKYIRFQLCWCGGYNYVHQTIYLMSYIWLNKSTFYQFEIMWCMKDWWDFLSTMRSHCGHFSQMNILLNWVNVMYEG